MNKIRGYSSSPLLTSEVTNLNPWFISGFSDAESSFSILIQPNSKYGTGWRVKPIFAIGLHKKDLGLLESIQSSLGVGKINTQGKSAVQYRVESIKDLSVIINHFENYPLVTVKKIDFILFKKAFNIIKLKEHLSAEGLMRLVGIKSSLNLGITTVLSEAFPNWKEFQISRPDYIFNGIPDPNWMSGFASGDSSFNVKISYSPTSLMSQRVQLRFGIGLNIRERAFVEFLATYFGLTNKTKNVYFFKDSVSFEVVNFSEIINIIIPFFDKHTIRGKKSLDFIDFKQVAAIVKSKDHLTSEGFNKILEIKAKMNE